MIFKIAADVSEVFNMAKRLITSGIGLIVFFAVFFANEFVFSLAIALVTMGLVYEAVSALKPGKTITIVSMIFAILGFFAGSIINPILLIFVFLILTVIFYGKVDFQKIFSAGFLTLYITTFMFFITELRTIGRYAVIPVFIFSWITDTGAYFTGSFIGKHKLAPNLSPKKTVEGAIGGIIATVLGTYIYTLVLKYAFSITLSSTWFLVAASAIGAVLSEVGDLAASAIKRMCGIKDFGKIFPGHGGFMDRFDSVIFVAPYTYLVFAFMDVIFEVGIYAM